MFWPAIFRSGVQRSLRKLVNYAMAERVDCDSEEIFQCVEAVWAVVCFRLCVLQVVVITLSKWHSRDFFLWWVGGGVNGVELSPLQHFLQICFLCIDAVCFRPNDSSQNDIAQKWDFLRRLLRVGKLS